MVKLKSSEIIKMSQEDKDKKLKELKLELIKAKISASKAGTSKIKQTRKMIARILTFSKSNKEELKK